MLYFITIYIYPHCMDCKSYAFSKPCTQGKRSKSERNTSPILTENDKAPTELTANPTAMVKTMKLCFAVRVVKQKLRHEPGAVVRICICTLQTKPSPCNNTLWSTIFGGSQRQRSKQPTKRNARPMIPNLTKAHSDDHDGSLKKF